MATALTAWLEYVQPECAPAPQDLCVRSIRDALIEFCEKTYFWRHEITAANAIDLVATQRAYDLTAAAGFPAGATVAHVQRLMFDGDEVDPVDPDVLDRDKPDWRTETGTTPLGYFHYDIDTVELYPIPSANDTDALTADLVLKPLRTATSVAFERIFEDWCEGVAAGAIARVKRMRGSTAAPYPWFDPEGSRTFMGEFEKACSRAWSIGQRHLVKNAKKRVVLHTF